MNLDLTAIRKGLFLIEMVVEAVLPEVEEVAVRKEMRLRGKAEAVELDNDSNSPAILLVAQSKR